MQILRRGLIKKTEPARCSEPSSHRRPVPTQDRSACVLQKEPAAIIRNAYWPIRSLPGAASRPCQHCRGPCPRPMHQVRSPCCWLVQWHISRRSTWEGERSDLDRIRGETKVGKGESYQMAHPRQSVSSRRFINDCRMDKIPGWFLDLPSSHSFLTLFLNVIEKGLHTSVLHRVLDRFVCGGWLEAISNDVGIDALDHGFFELVVNRLVYVDALGIQANLKTTMWVIF